jgi:hypothetical protein
MAKDMSIWSGTKSYAFVSRVSGSKAIYSHAEKPYLLSFLETLIHSNYFTDKRDGEKTQKFPLTERLMRKKLRCCFWEDFRLFIELAFALLVVKVNDFFLLQIFLHNFTFSIQLDAKEIVPALSSLHHLASNDNECGSKS